MIFKVVIVMLNYGILTHLEDIKNLVVVIFDFIEKQKIISQTILDFINDFILFNQNYSLNCILKDLDSGVVNSNNSNDLGIFDKVYKNENFI